MSKLAEKIRKAREKRMEVDGFGFTVRRPTDLDMLELRGGVSPRMLMAYVVDWDGVKEIDLIPGGDGAPLAFDAEACAEWVADRPDIFAALVNEIMDSYRAHQEAQEAAKKN